MQFIRKISLKDYKNIAKSVLIQEVLQGINGLATECRQIAREIGLEDLMLYRYSKKDIKEAVKAAMKKEFLEEMQSSVKVKDRLSDDPEENSYTVYHSKTRRLCSIGYYSPHNNTRIQSNRCFEKFRKFSI